MTHASNPAHEVPTRRMSLDESFDDVPKHFAVEGDLILSHVAAALSAVFPAGEAFFVRSVRRFRDQVTDPELRRQVAGFIGEETMHGREHRAFNDRLDRLGYPTKRVERFSKWALETRERILSAKSNLAVTAALEHFTATLAELVLTSEEARTLFGDEQVKNLFVWHALEESEHKAVAFDVYTAVGGTERMRMWTMHFMTFAFLTGMAVQVALSLLVDPATYRPGNFRRSWGTFRRSTVMRRALWRHLREYNRPGFHPDDRDGLVEYWRTELFGEHGTLTDRLIPSPTAA